MISLKFMDHIMLSFGRYTKELDMSLHGSTKEKLGHVELIGNNNDQYYLHIYSN